MIRVTWVGKARHCRRTSTSLRYMKTLLRLGIPTVIMAVFVGALGLRAAESVPGQREQAVHHAKMAIIGQELGLKDDQKAKLKDLRSQSAEAIRTIRANPALTPEQKHEQIASMRKASRAQMQAMLTPDQQTRLAQIMSHPGRLRAQAVHRVRMGVLANRLGLTHEQRIQIRTIHTTTLAAVTPIRADASLTPEQKKAKVTELRQAGRDQARAVLTADQRQKLNQIEQRLLGPLG